ncbi:MAG TPA: GDP-mannose 4,6-dehydratase [Phycisphaerae bacterium]|nr:GDP-mannose 4,6-dehydratase [Phycisphaerae bacterium]
MPERRLLVTGATGFVGRWVLRHWRQEHPRTRLVATSHLPEPDDLPCDGYAQVDLRDRQAVCRFVAESRPDAVIHLAGLIASDDLHEQLAVNVEATENLYLALLAGPRAAEVRMVQVGSAAAYGAVEAEELPISEAQPFRPLTPYGLSKAAQDHLAHMTWRRNHLPIIRARVFNLLGPGQPAQLVPMTFLTQLAGLRGGEGGCLRVGDTSARRDYVDVRDAAAAFDALLQRGQPGQAYNVATGRDVSVAELLEEIFAIAAFTPRVETASDRRRPVDVPCVRADVSKIDKATGWRTALSLKQSLTDMWESVSRA